MKTIHFAVFDLAQEHVLESARAFGPPRAGVKREPHPMQEVPESGLAATDELLFREELQAGLHHPCLQDRVEEVELLLNLLSGHVLFFRNTLKMLQSETTSKLKKV